MTKPLDSATGPAASESHSSFCSLLPPLNFLPLPPTFLPLLQTQEESLKTLTRSGIDLLLHFYNLSWSLNSLSSIWKCSSIIYMHKIGKSLVKPTFFRSTSLTPCVLKLFERIILFRLLLLHRHAVFRRGRSTLYQILHLSRSISNGLT